MSCAVLTKKRILSSDIFRCLRNTIMRNAMLAIATRISAYSNNAHMLSQMGCSTIISMLRSSKTIRRSSLDMARTRRV